jgi:squalene-associated FAD-dependent desaturase
MVGIEPGIIVVGGGLAGIAAACDLSDSGLLVTLLEARPFLGGKTWSFRDEQTGMVVDNGQHVFLSCCTAYLAFLQRLGIESLVYMQPRLRVPIFSAGYPATTLEASHLPLPAPLHLFWSFLRLPFLSWREKLHAARTLLRIARAGERGRVAYEHLSFASWLRAQGETELAIRALWNLITLPTINEDCERASAGLAMMVFQESLLRSASGGRLGYAKVGLSDLICEAATRYLEARGATLRLGCRVTGVEIMDGQVQGVRLANREMLPAQHVILALPHYAIASLLPPDYRNTFFFLHTTRLDTSPILGINLWLDRTVMKEPFAAVIGRQETYWVFDKGALFGLNLDGGQYLTLSISGAHRYLAQSRESIIAQARGDLEAVFPALRQAQINHALVIKERQATFSARSGSLENRLPAATPISGLFLAGAWTDTGWPATMEGALRSGHAAAQAAISSREARIKTPTPPAGTKAPAAP